VRPDAELRIAKPIGRWQFVSEFQSALNGPAAIVGSCSELVCATPLRAKSPVPTWLMGFDSLSFFFD
jgi:hypothetical protein